MLEAFIFILEILLYTIHHYNFLLIIYGAVSASTL